MELLSLLLHLGYDLQLHAAALTAAPDRVLKKNKRSTHHWTHGNAPRDILDFETEVVRNGVWAASS